MTSALGKKKAHKHNFFGPVDLETNPVEAQFRKGSVCFPNGVFQILNLSLRQR